MRPDKSQRTRLLHSESVFKKSDGTFETLVTQQGTVDAISDSAISVKSEDGFSQSYALNADTKIVKVPGPAANSKPSMGDDGKRRRPADITAAEIATGGTVRILGVRNGSDVAARQLIDGPLSEPGVGFGHGRGLGHGQSLGLGRTPAKGTKD
ncbi:hypothetical protein V3C33_00620 [Micrococcaceae bacterium Sec5.7]